MDRVVANEQTPQITGSFLFLFFFFFLISRNLHVAFHTPPGDSVLSHTFGDSPSSVHDACSRNQAYFASPPKARPRFNLPL